MALFEKIFSKLSLLVLFGLTFLIFFFFLTITREYLLLTKYYFFLVVAFILILLVFIKTTLTYTVKTRPNDAAPSFFLFLVAISISTLVMSPNTFQSLFHAQVGLLVMIGFGVLFFTLSGIEKKHIQTFLLLFYTSLALVSLVTMILSLPLVSKAGFPSSLSFLQAPQFNPVGNIFELLSILGIGFAGILFRLWNMYEHKKFGQKRILQIVYLTLSTIIGLGLLTQLILLIYNVVIQGNNIVLPPLVISWYAAVEILKNPLTALFGVGVDNFAVLFSQMRNTAYNTTELWNINTFSLSSSTFLHILTETGLVGLVGFLSFVIIITKKALKSHKELLVLLIATLTGMLISSPSFIVLFVFFLLSGLILADTSRQGSHYYEISFHSIKPVFIGLAMVLLFVLGWGMLYISRTFASEVYFKRGLDGIVANDLNQLYENQRLAIQYNPRNETFRRNFSQTNLIIANNIANKGEEELTDTDRQTILQALQTAINEGKVAVNLNAQKVTNWINLASVYREIIHVAEDAPDWTVSTYRQAIALDINNPVLRFELGSVYYLLEQYEDAQILFQQATLLKPDWENARYNLAWAYFQDKKYAQAVEQMQLTLALINPAEEEESFKTAQKDLEIFQRAQEEARTEAEEQVETTQPNTDRSTGSLTLPTPPAQINDKVDLPDEASPEAGFED